MISIQFLGACDSVTGSQYLITANQKKFLLECGLFQGKRSESEKRNRNFAFHPEEIDCLLISHAHIDHSGNIPNLVKQGFRGKIYGTSATCALLEPMLLDSAKIQTHDAQWLNKRKRGTREPLIEPLYTEQEVRKTFGQFEAKTYDETFEICVGARVTFLDAGHILGSALIRIEFDDGERQVRFGYTGDLGRKFLPIIKDPEQLTDLDYLIMESTYGDRLHSDISVSYKDLAEIVNTTVHRGGKVIIPSFAVARAQELLYILHELKDTKKIPYDLPVYLDTPLGIEVTDVFTKYLHLYDQESNLQFLSKNDNPFTFHGLTYVQSVTQSKALNYKKEPSVIISSSGMAEFGRIRHHLVNTIEDPKNTIAFVGFQARHTTGRKILRGEKKIRILDQELTVRAEIRVLNSLSAHADQNDLLRFSKSALCRRKLFLVHGEEKSKAALKEILEKEIDAKVVLPACGESFEL